MTRGRRAAALVAFGAILVVTGCSRTPRSVGILPFFPGAVVVGTTSFDGPLAGFPQASWTQVELRSEAKYEAVRDFYKEKAGRNPGAAFENESQKRGGRIFTRLLSDRARTEFYMITVEERTASRDVSVLLRRGLVKK